MGWLFPHSHDSHGLTARVAHSGIPSRMSMRSIAYLEGRTVLVVAVGDFGQMAADVIGHIAVRVHETQFEDRLSIPPFSSLDVIHHRHPAICMRPRYRKSPDHMTGPGHYASTTVGLTTGSAGNLIMQVRLLHDSPVKIHSPPICPAYPRRHMQPAVHPGDPGDIQQDPSFKTNRLLQHPLALTITGCRQDHVHEKRFRRFPVQRLAQIVCAYSPPASLALKICKPNRIGLPIDLIDLINDPTPEPATFG